MNKIKLFITSGGSGGGGGSSNNNIHTVDHLAAEKKLSNKIKKFNSERNLFFANIYSSNHTGATPPAQPVERPASRLEKTKTFCKNGLLKKCKSLKELYQNTSSSKNTPATTDTTTSPSHNKFDNLDEFERSYLFSAGKRELVNELRKNFENKPPPVVPLEAPIVVAVQKTTASSHIQKKDKKIGPRACVTRHSFNMPSATAMAAADEEDFQSLIELPPVPPPVPMRPKFIASEWSQSAMNLSTVTSLGAPPTPIPARRTADDDDDDGTAAFAASSSRPINRMGGHFNSGGMDTMSLCDVNMYPIYMQNIYDPNIPKPDCTAATGTTISATSSGYSSSASSAGELKPPIKLKKCSSVNQIDLNVLRSELDDFVDLQWGRLICGGTFDRNCGIQRSMPMVAIRRKVCLLYSNALFF